MKGQALAETALVGTLLALLAYGFLAMIPAHRARTVANAAAYACVQFATQSPGNPYQAALIGREAARRTINGDWSESLGVRYAITNVTPAGPGGEARCTVQYRAPRWFGFGDPKTEQITVVGRGERWKARW